MIGSPIGRQRPFRVLRFDLLDSTNDEAMARLRAGEAGPFALTARSQTRGRGRQGRSWASPVGNFYASLALRDPAAAACAPQLGFVAGVALIEALRAAVPGAEPRLKWPNDILLDGRKLAGMLLEGATLPDGRFGCVIGIGVNCVSHPEGLPYPATDLRAFGSPEPALLLQALLRHFELRFADWDRGRRFALIRSLWLDSAFGIGEPIEVKASHRSIAGIFRDIDGDGRLLLDTRDGVVAVEAGDVFFPAAMADTP